MRMLLTKKTLIGFAVLIALAAVAGGLVLLRGSGKADPVKYQNANVDIITVSLPQPGAVTGKTFSVVGQARGHWYFEGVFPVQVLDKDGAVVATAQAHASRDATTDDFVPFKADIQIPDTYSGPATIMLARDNPSGNPAADASISFPVTIK